jgi:hypothetical protein
MTDQTDMTGTGVYAPEVLDFVRSANDYCQWLEVASGSSALQFISDSIKVLSKVYYHATLVSDTEPVMEGGNEKFVTEKEWSGIFQNVLQLLDVHNEYLRIAREDEFDRSDLVTHKISEDLADIYQDLKDFTMQYRQGIEEVMNDAVWEVKDNFENYWSEKLLNALTALNRLFVKKIDPHAEMDPMDETEVEGGQPPSYDNSFFTRLQDLNEEDIDVPE